MPKIASIHAREILDSRGKPTVEGGVVGTASVPSGASTGAAEACELRDGESGRYDGQGVRRAVENVNRIIGPALLGTCPGDQQGIDAALLARAGACAGDYAFAPLIPLPMTNMISGGKHAGGNLDFQDVLVIPKGASSYPVGLEWIVRVYRRLGELL